MPKGNIDNIQLNHSAAFYRLKSTQQKLRDLRKVLRIAARHETGSRDYYVYKLRENVIIEDKTLQYSICVFRYDGKSPLFVNEVADYKEYHVGYLMVVEYGDYVTISKRGVEDISLLTEQLDTIPSDILCNSFVNDDTNIERLSMRNLDASDNALRAKSVEGLDIRQSYSGYGANRNLVKSVRLNSDSNHRKNVTTATSFITETGIKASVINYVSWVKVVVDTIMSYVPHSTFLDIFAQSVDFATYKDQLTPVSILFYQDKILSDLESGLITKVFFYYTNGEYEIDIDKWLRKFERCLDIEKRDEAYYVKNNIDTTLQVKKCSSSIRLSGGKLFRHIYIRSADGTERNLISYLNLNKCFSIYFSERDLIYNNNKLLKDNQLLGNIKTFLNVFDGCDKLSNVYSEKGDIANNPNAFEEQSVFRFTEDVLCTPKDYAFGILDDLGNEWADHIGVSNNKIAFFVEKCKNSKNSTKERPISPHFSASAFQDVVAQAEKNLGNLTVMDHLLDEKHDFWLRNYNNDNINTNIPRLRFGVSVEDAISKWKEVKRAPNHQTEMNLVVNFISKAELTDKLEHFQDENVSISHKNEVMQILWLVSSLINCAREVGANVHIYCKP